MISAVFRFAVMVSSIVFVSCASDRVLDVNRITVKNTHSGHLENSGLLKMQTDHRMYGVVAESEREERVGQYYRIKWQNPEGRRATRLIFRYQRAAERGRITKQVFDLPSDSHGVIEVPIVGKDLAKKGRILLWRAELMEKNEMIASEQSYLW